MIEHNTDFLQSSPWMTPWLADAPYRELSPTVSFFIGTHHSHPILFSYMYLCFLCFCLYFFRRVWRLTKHRLSWTWTKFKPELAVWFTLIWIGRRRVLVYFNDMWRNWSHEMVSSDYGQTRTIFPKIFYAYSFGPLSSKFRETLRICCWYLCRLDMLPYEALDDSFNTVDAAFSVTCGKKWPLDVHVKIQSSWGTSTVAWTGSQHRQKISPLVLRTASCASF